MSDKVLIRVENESYDKASDESIEVVYTGVLGEVNNNIYVHYDELLEGESRMTRNMIKICPEETRVEITKRGPVTAHMSFKAGEKSSTFYETPFGAVSMGIYTHELSIDIDGKDINIYLDYAIESNYETVSECRVMISIRRIERETQC